MLKYFILVGLLILSSLTFIFFWVGVPTIHVETVEDNRQTQLYNDSDQSISRINITAFYFVARDRNNQFSLDWQAPIENSLKELQLFHHQQTQGLSQLTYTIYPVPIIGDKNRIEYDTIDTNRGNPQGLRQVAQELIDKNLLPENNDTNNVFQSVLIVYEGVGASASEHVAFLNNVYLSQDQYINSYGSSFLAHEFYHTIGVPDTYISEDDVPLSHDLMGMGRYRPLSLTYLSQEVMDSLGL